ncbi:hypothetical protein [Lentibacillus sediminis]|uniref:hypothetical protein n=1 Tax=Lentibacillus sediminis TaxID=1940529 RepID=UPI000C1BFB44|nr:hypothetical protein [Lentibacillus sediminis]
MGKRKLLLGMTAGAAVGGILMLLDRETRMYTKTKWNDTKSGSAYVVKNPSEVVRKAILALGKLNENFPSGAANVINALEQVENQLDRFTSKNETKHIE